MNKARAIHTVSSRPRIGRGERGASIVIALLFLLVCTVVAAILIGSASSTVEQGRKHAAEERSFYSVSSALETARLQFWESKPLVTDADGSISASSAPANSPQEWAQQELALCLADASHAVQPYTATAEYSGGNEESIVPVELTYSMPKAAGSPARYHVTITGRAAGDGDAGAYTLQCELPCTMQTAADGTVTYSWTAPGNGRSG